MLFLGLTLQSASCFWVWPSSTFCDMIFQKVQTNVNLTTLSHRSSEVLRVCCQVFAALAQAHRWSLREEPAGAVLSSGLFFFSVFSVFLKHVTGQPEPSIQNMLTFFLTCFLLERNSLNFCCPNKRQWIQLAISFPLVLFQLPGFPGGSSSCLWTHCLHLGPKVRAHLQWKTG